MEGHEQLAPDEQPGIEAITASEIPFNPEQELTEADWQMISEGVEHYAEGSNLKDQAYRLLARASLISPQRFQALPYVQQLTPEKFWQDYNEGHEQSGHVYVAWNAAEDQVTKLLVMRQLQSLPAFQATWPAELEQVEVSDHRWNLLLQQFNAPMTDFEVFASLNLLYPDRQPPLPLEKFRSLYQERFGKEWRMRPPGAYYAALYRESLLQAGDWTELRKQFAATRTAVVEHGAHAAWDLTAQAETMALLANPTISVPGRRH